MASRNFNANISIPIVIISILINITILRDYLFVQANNTDHSTDPTTDHVTDHSTGHIIDHTTDPIGGHHNHTNHSEHGRDGDEAGETGHKKCKPLNYDTNRHDYLFFPDATKAGFAFISISFGLIIFAKIMYNSTDHYKVNNRYDLIIFKPPSKNSALGPMTRRIYPNSHVSQHNLNAAITSGFNVNSLNSIRTGYSPLVPNGTMQDSLPFQNMNDSSQSLINDCVSSSTANLLSPNSDSNPSTSKKLSF